jgi:hypothetical protein
MVRIQTTLSSGTCGLLLLLLLLLLCVCGVGLLCEIEIERENITVKCFESNLCDCERDKERI